MREISWAEWVGAFRPVLAPGRSWSHAWRFAVAQYALTGARAHVRALDDAVADGTAYRVWTLLEGGVLVNGDARGAVARVVTSLPWVRGEDWRVTGVPV